MKHDKGRYYVWRGIDAGFDDDPVASLHPADKKKKKSTRSSPKSTSKKGRVSLDALDDSDIGSTPTRNLRGRTERQQHPYQADKIEHKHASKGNKLSDKDLSKELKRTRSPTVMPSRKRRSTSSRRSAASIASLSSSVTSMYADVDVKLTTVRAHFSEVGSAVQTLALTAKTADELIDEMEKQWEFQLGDRKIKLCTVCLPWESENSNLLLIRNNNMGNTFDTILNEIRRAPTWESSGNCFIDIELQV